MGKYNHKEIEQKWQKIWEENKVVKIDKDDTKNKYYVLDMFPYPSGDGLHMGHTESYTASDVFYRFKKMQGFNVLHPQGFDAFGLPAENFAIKTKVHPAQTTEKNINNYIRQMKSLGLNYDFDEQAVTSDPKYYKWTQWIFEQFYKNGLVYKRTQKTNWCSSCQTVIANEQVVNGECERCGTKIEQKEIPGWFFKITDFADDLIDGLDKVDWPEHTKKNQINWIGKSEGAKITFKLTSNSQQLTENIEVFTTRPDTLFGATYMVLAPEHSLVTELKDQIANWGEVEKYIEETKNKTELDRLEAKEKTGVKLEGIFAINPANKEEIPIFIADYVLGGYGTGAIMAVPAHDERDFEFAKKYNLPVVQVVSIKDSFYRSVVWGWGENETVKDLIELGINILEKVETNTGAGEIIFKIEIPKDKIESFVELIEKKLKPLYWNEFIGESGITFIFKHKDNKVEKINLSKETEDKIDRLTYEFFNEHPVPKDYKRKESVWKHYSEVENGFYKDLIIHSEKGMLINSEQFTGINSEEAKQKITEFVGGEMTSNYRLRDWSISRQRYWGCPIPIVYSPEGEAQLIPEEYLPWTLPTDVDFKPTGVSPLGDSKEFKERTEKIFGKGWTPEYDTMDTFVDSAWYFLRYPDIHNEKEFCSETRKKWLPVDLYIGGAEHTYMHLLFARFFTKAMHKIGLISFDEPFLKLRHQGMVLDAQGKKMSKSKGNVVNPDEMIKRFGADSVRTYMLFAAPLEDEVIWNEDNIVGIYRFLEKVWKIKSVVFASSGATAEERGNPASSLEKQNKVKNLLHKTIKKVSGDIENLKYNTAVSSMMILINEMEKVEEINKEDYESFLKLLSPFAPHITQELWEQLGNESLIQNESWTEYNKDLAKDDTYKIAVQVNGKVRDEIEIEEGTDEEDVKKKAFESKIIQKWLEGKEPKKVIYVKNRILNVVVDNSNK
ncbi:leucine--tRNA ligase [Candidatus Parcubacteria bacterium]|nr:leucine--tRNA ligase [Candidatus Parcubacteria bacterium]